MPVPPITAMRMGSGKDSASIQVVLYYEISPLYSEATFAIFLKPMCILRAAVGGRVDVRARSINRMHRLKRSKAGEAVGCGRGTVGSELFDPDTWVGVPYLRFRAIPRASLGDILQIQYNSTPTST